MANAKPEIPCEVSSGGTKRESSEDALKYDSDDLEDSDYSIDYDSDDPTFEISEGKADRKIWKQYYKEWDESEGFDISVHPGTSFMAGIAPQHDHLRNPKIKQEYTEMCKLAIDDFNSKNDDKMYTFEEIVSVTASFAAGGIWYYFTFKARDTTVDSAADAIETFQAAVWNGIDKTIEVHFCRLKKLVTNEEVQEHKGYTPISGGEGSFKDALHRNKWNLGERDAENNKQGALLSSSSTTDNNLLCRCLVGSFPNSDKIPARNDVMGSADVKMTADFQVYDMNGTPLQIGGARRHINDWE